MSAKNGTVIAEVTIWDDYGQTPAVVRCECGAETTLPGLVLHVRIEHIRTGSDRSDVTRS